MTPQWNGFNHLQTPRSLSTENQPFIPVQYLNR